ncbi:NADP-dependent oxidoreductase [Lacticaseibacillus brantae]|uniref:Oxidoreductase n=1 Tax=Lacticaseibacillus brantae DSM 23927 TaxID=1423727 RepID=A0A0R2AWN2_9LACO|nr:NADP-dependent oxidoreductase [Lacticaseibacillus brantae]KRM71816.1 oxidoreductase [Lacticaseibacillus brantae DSM 23927]
MKTIAIKEFGAANVLTEMPLPEMTTNDNEILVGVHAFSINPMDIAGRMGQLGSPFTDEWTFPIVLGYDFAGVVQAVGANVTQYQVGDRVFGQAPTTRPGNNGAYSEAVVVTADLIAPMPAGLTFDQAAALPIAGLTAYCAIAKNLNVQPGEKVLIQGGSGGVGLFAVQIAKALGAYVATTASPSHHELLKSLNIDEVIDYHKVSPADVLHDYDAVFDTVGDIDTGLKVLKADGKLVTVAAQPTPEQQHHLQQDVMFQFTNGTPADLTTLANYVLNGQIKLSMKTMAFTAADVIQAHEEIQGRHVTGKIVIHVKD